jgi:hypothetical protein
VSFHVPAGPMYRSPRNRGPWYTATSARSPGNPGIGIVNTVRSRSELRWRDTRRMQNFSAESGQLKDREQDERIELR